MFPLESLTGSKCTPSTLYSTVYLVTCSSQHCDLTSIFLPWVITPRIMLWELNWTCGKFHKNIACYSWILFFIFIFIFLQIMQCKFKATLKNYGKYYKFYLIYSLCLYWMQRTWMYWFLSLYLADHPPFK